MEGFMSLLNGGNSLKVKSLYIIESVDSISRDGPDMPYM